MPFGPPVSETTCTMPYSQATWSNGAGGKELRVGPTIHVMGCKLKDTSEGWDGFLPQTGQRGHTHKYLTMEKMREGHEDKSP